MFEGLHLFSMSLAGVLSKLKHAGIFAQKSGAHCGRLKIILLSLNLKDFFYTPYIIVSEVRFCEKRTISAEATARYGITDA